MSIDATVWAVVAAAGIFLVGGIGLALAARPRAPGDIRRSMIIVPAVAISTAAVAAVLVNVTLPGLSEYWYLIGLLLVAAGVVAVRRRHSP